MNKDVVDSQDQSFDCGTQSKRRKEIVLYYLLVRTVWLVILRAVFHCAAR